MMKRPVRATAFALGVGVAATPALASADILWSGDFETADLGQYNEFTGPVNERVTIVTDPVRQGTYAARVEIRPGDLGNGNLNRVELGYHPPMEGFQGSERWYAFSAMQDPDAPLGDSWHAFAYWEADVLYTGTLVFGLHPGGELRFDTRVGDDETQFSTWFQPGVWHDFALHVVWSPDPQEGLVELWYDGEQVVPPTPVATMHTMAGGAAATNFFHIGMIRDETIPQTEVLFYDRVLEATDAEDVMGDDEPGGTSSDGGADDTGAGASTSDADGDAGDGTTTGEDDGTPGITDDAAPTDDAIDATITDDGTDDGSTGNAAAEDTDAEGCGCRTDTRGISWLALALLPLVRRRRRRAF
jgi:hypothetical protein